MRTRSSVTSRDESAPKIRMNNSPCPERSNQKSARKARIKR
jgi:hypothetical protein